jgi:hypothetical protein
LSSKKNNELIKLTKVDNLKSSATLIFSFAVSIIKKDIMKETDQIIKPVIKLLEELKTKFNSIDPPKRYYRNKHLKSYFGLSDNTIISYRDKNLLPFTKIGEIYYYPIAEIENILTQNSNFDFTNNPIKKGSIN